MVQIGIFIEKNHNLYVHGEIPDHATGQCDWTIFHQVPTTYLLIINYNIITTSDQYIKNMTQPFKFKIRKVYTE